MKGLALLFLAGALQAQTPIANMLTDSTMIQHLERIADTATVETARCLVGSQRDSTLRIAGAAETPWLIGAQTDSTVHFSWWNCPEGTVALWHNHIAAWTRSHYPGVSSCFLGKSDVAILRQPKAPPVAIVSVRVGESCVFLREPDGRVVGVRIIR